MNLDFGTVNQRIIGRVCLVVIIFRHPLLERLRLFMFRREHNRLQAKADAQGVGELFRESVSENLMIPGDATRIFGKVRQYHKKAAYDKADTV